MKNLIPKKIGFCDVRDDIIPGGKNIQLEKFLDKNKLNQYHIERLIGASIAENNHIATSLLNLYREENNITIEKESVLESIYWANCRKISRANGIHTHLNWSSFNNKLESEYEYIYADIFTPFEI